MFKDETSKNETRKNEAGKDETGKPGGAGRLISDLRSAKLELLSAQSPQTASVFSIRLQILFLSGNRTR
jgi:hypothetical protein